MIATSYKVTIEPTSEPVTLAEAKAQTRVESSFTGDDAYLESAVKVAREVVEQVTERRLMAQTIELALNGFPPIREIELPGSPLSSVSSVQYYDADNALQTYSSSNYSQNTYCEPGSIERVYGQDWPDTYDRFDAVKITYVAGYASAAAVPSAIKHAILMLVSDIYGKRDAMTEQGMKSAMRKSAEMLLTLNKTYARW